MLTSEISTANSLPPPKMADANVGVLRHHLYEAILIAHQGGILVDIDPVNVTDGIHELINMMNNKVQHFRGPHGASLQGFLGM